MMDAIRIIAYNMFRAMIGIFRPIYNNYRNDHVMLRMLTRTDGFIWRTGQIIHIQLWLKGRYQLHQKKIFQSFIDKMNHFINGHFQKRAATVKIELVDNASKLSSITQNNGVQIVQHHCLKDWVQAGIFVMKNPTSLFFSVFWDMSAWFVRKNVVVVSQKYYEEGVGGK